MTEPRTPSERDEGAISVEPHRLGFRLNLPHIWAGGVLVGEDEARELFEALRSAWRLSALDDAADVIETDNVEPFSRSMDPR